MLLLLQSFIVVGEFEEQVENNEDSVEAEEGRGEEGNVRAANAQSDSGSL